MRHERALRYTANQIAEMIKPPIFEYQKVPLPFGLSSPGHDRRETCDLIFPTTLDSASVLDIGSALGAVSFEAEKRGAARVVGLEPRASRFQASIILKEILCSEVEFKRNTLNEFLLQESVSGATSRRFDYVLLLNVIHHLEYPISSLIDCARLAKAKFIIEFPTLDDPIFAGVPPMLAIDLNKLALIGVSTRAADQTFVFTQLALERILLDHHKIFSKALFTPSPMQSGRVIGVFER